MFSSRVDRWCWVMGARLAPLAVARLSGGAGVDWYGVDWYGVDWLGGVGDGAFRWQPSNPCRQSISRSRARATTLIGSRRGMRTSQPPKSLMARQPLQSPRRRCAPLETFARDLRKRPSQETFARDLRKTFASAMPSSGGRGLLPFAGWLRATLRLLEERRLHSGNSLRSNIEHRLAKSKCCGSRDAGVGGAS
jgi:hypothetical protein